MFFFYPPAVAFWFPVRGTGGFLKGWPRFIPACRSLFGPAGGTVEAQSVLPAALPVLCCMGDRLGIPMNFFLLLLLLFFFFASTQSLFLSPVPSLTPSSSNFLFPLIFLSLSLPPHPPVFVLRCSYFLSACLISRPSPSLAAFVAVWVEGCQLQQQVWAVQSFVIPLREKKHLLLMLPPSLSFCVPLSQAIWFLPSSQLLSLLFVTPPLLSFLKSPFGRFSRRFHFPKMSASYPTWGCNFSVSSVAGWMVVL